MKRLAIVVIVAALAWSGYWLYSAQALRSGIETWFEDRRAEGWQADYADLSIRGFPNRLDATFTDLALGDPDSGLAWRTPMLQVMQLVYDRDHTILAFADSQQVSTDAGDYTLASEGLRASIVTGPGDTILRAGFEADVLNVDRPRGGLALAGLTGGLEAVDADAAAYRIGIAADALAGASTGGAAEGAALRATVAFDRPWTRAALEKGRPQPTRIALDTAEYRQNDLFLRLGGTLDIDRAGRASGTLALRAENWRALLDAAVEAGRMPRSLARTLAEGLGVVAALSGNPDRLELPLDFDRGQVRVGPVPVGEAPRLRLP